MHCIFPLVKACTGFTAMVDYDVRRGLSRSKLGGRTSNPPYVLSKTTTTGTIKEIMNNEIRNFASTARCLLAGR